MNTFDVLDPGLNVCQSLLLEASAGTGKTYSIENIVTRSLLESSLSIKDILVVTFTKAAAKELKERIFHNLQKKLALFKEDKPAAQKLRRSLIEFDEASISTIHAFCYKALTEHSLIFRSKNTLQELPEEVLWEVIERIFRTSLKDELFSEGQLSLLLKAHQGKVTRLALALIKAQRRGVPYGEVKANHKILERIEALIKPIDGASHLLAFEKTAFLFYGVTEGKTQKPKEAIFQFFKSLFSLMGRGGLSMRELDPLLEEAQKYLPLVSEKNVKASAKEKAPYSLTQICEALFPLFEELGSYPFVFTRLAKLTQEAVWKTFEERELTDFSYLLRKMKELSISDLEFKKRLQERYKMVIIDEFQDTDPTQWKIFKEIFQKAKVPLILVGDPKQSIYAFRSADIYTYLDAAQTIEPSSRYLLSTNYRSSKPLIHALNHIFSEEHAPGFISLPHLNSHLRAYPVLAPSSAKESLATPVSFLCVNAVYEGKILKIDQLEERFLFPYFVKEVALLKEKMPLNQIAFLVRDHAQGDRLFKYLISMGISAVKQKSLELSESSLLEELIYLLRAVFSFKRAGYLEAALGTQFFGWSVEAIEGLKELNIFAQVVFHFQKWHQVISEEGVTSFFREFLSTRFLNDEKTLQEKWLNQKEGLINYLELRQFIEWLALKETQLCPLLEALESLASVEGSIQEEKKLRPFKEQDAVNILTLHMSKGLEFEAVFALGVMNRSPFDEEIVPIRKQGEIVLVPLFQDDERRDAYLEESDAEKARQLYVALTRAKSHLYIPCVEGLKPPPLGGASPLELHLARMGEPLCSWRELYQRFERSSFQKLDELGARSPEIAIVKLFESIAAPASSQRARFDPIPPPSISLQYAKRYASSFTSLSKVSGVFDLPEGPRNFESEDLSPHLIPCGISTGELFHKILEEIPFRMVLEAQASCDLLPFIERFVLRTPYARWKEIIAKMVFDAFKTPIGKDQILLEQLDEAFAFREMEFVYPVTDGVIKGVIDLFFLWNGKYYLLDWKTNWLGNNESEYTDEARAKVIKAHGYDLQAALYKTAISKYLATLDNRPFEKIFGGMIFHFLRGNISYFMEAPR